MVLLGLAFFIGDSVTTRRQPDDDKTASIRVHDWEKWQSYRNDRGIPPWIKVHRCLMTCRKWASLSDAEKGQLVSIWIAAADKDGSLPADPTVIRKICQLDNDPDIEKFLSLQLLDLFVCQDDANLTPRRRQLDAPEKKREEKIKELSSKPDDSVVEVFLYWQKIMGTEQAKLSPKRMAKIKARLKEYSVAQIKEAIDGCKKSGWHMGQNKDKKKYNDIELICREPEKVDAFLSGAAAEKGHVVISANGERYEF